MRKIQEGLDRTANEDKPTIHLWLDEDALPKGDLALRKRYYCDESRGREYKKYLDDLVTSAIEGYAQAVKETCAFCGVHAEAEYARRGIPRCRTHRYIDIEDFSAESWDDIYSDRIDRINREADILLNAYKKWHAVEYAEIIRGLDGATAPAFAQHKMARLTSPRFITSMAMGILLRNSQAKPDWKNRQRLVNTFCEDIMAGHKCGVDTLPMLIALGILLLLQAGDQAVPLSFADGLLAVNDHDWTITPSECVRALEAVKVNLWSPAEFADWISGAIKPIAEDRVWVA